MSSLQLAERARFASEFFSMRAENPLVPARRLFEYLKDETGEPLEQYLCAHEWAYTGTAYGGDDERWCGEGRCICSKCGADGDS